MGRMMAEGFDKLQKALDEKVAARAAVQAVNEDLKAKLAATKDCVEKERLTSGAIADEIKAIENRNTECAKALADLEKTIASERTKLQADLKHAKETMTLEKTNATKDLAAMKDKCSSATGGYNGLKNRAIAAEADKVALKGEIACIGEEVGRLDKAATRLLREKHEMWQSISELQSTITSELTRASRLANEGFEVSGEEAALLKLYYKMQHYVNYRLAKRS